MHHLTMDSFTVELVSNASFDCYPNNTLSCFTNFLPEQINLEGEWEVAISELSYPSMYQNITGGKFLFVDDTTDRAFQSWEELLEPYFLAPGLYPSIADVVKAMNKLISEREKTDRFQITFSVDKISQQLYLHLPTESSKLVLHSGDLSHVFGADLKSNETGVWMSGKGPHKPQFAYDIVRIHTLMIYTDIVEYNIVGDTKAPLLRCIPFISKLKSGDIITTGQYMNYQTFQNLQFKRLLKNAFHSIRIELRDATGEKIPFVSVGITRLVLMFRKVNDNHF